MRVKEKAKDTAKENKNLKKLHVLRKKLGHARRELNTYRLRQEIAKFDQKKSFEPYQLETALKVFF